MKKILIVDDEEALRKVLSLKLESEDYEILEASNGQECLDILSKTEVDLVLLDLTMPIMDGTEVVKQINSMEFTNKKPEVIILTNNSEMDSISEMMASGMFSYIVKSDHSLESIVEEVRNKLE